MFIAKKDDLIILARDTQEELENALQFMNYDSIEKTDVEYTLMDGMYMTALEAEAKERERINMLSLTAADVERAIYKAKGLDFEDILEQLSGYAAEQLGGLDLKALKIELKANNFYRGNPYIDAVGTILGFTKEQLDEFFETNDYRYLTTCTLTINATPIEATVAGAGVHPYGTVVDVNIECEGYVTHTETVTLTEDKTLNIKLDGAQDENTTDTTESDVSI